LPSLHHAQGVVALCFVLSIPCPATASSAAPTGDFKLVARSAVLHRENGQAVQRHAFNGKGDASAAPKSMTLSLPRFTHAGDTLDLIVPTLKFRPFHNDYIARGVAKANVGGKSVHVDATVQMQVKVNKSGADLRGTMFGRIPGEAVVRTTFRGTPAKDNPSNSPKPNAPPANLALPAKPLAWSQVPKQFRPPAPNQVHQIISPNDPDLRAKLANPNRKGWLIVRGNTPFPLGEFEFYGWVRIECPRMNLTWEYNSIRGLGGDDRLWLEGVEVVGPGDATIFQGVNYLYTNHCLFRRFGHVILDTGYWAGFDGCILNTEFRQNYHDPFQYFGGAVVNVAITSMAAHPTAHPDFFQTTYSRGLYWKHVWCGSPKNPIPMMGIRGFGIYDSHFEDVRHYRKHDTGHFSLDIVDASGTVFKDCVFTGPLRANGAKFK